MKSFFRVHALPMAAALLAACTGNGTSDPASSAPPRELGDPTEEVDASAEGVMHDSNDRADASSPGEASHQGIGPPGPDASPLDGVCTPGFTLQLEDDDPRRTKLFLDAVDGDPQRTAQAIGRTVCRLLYRKPNEVRSATHLRLIIRYAPGEVAWKAGDGADITVMISSAHLAEVAAAGRNVAAEIKGVLFHEMTHMYQHDDADGGGVNIGLIEGIADFVRFRAGFTPDGAVPNPNGNWDDGYRTTAFFLVWVDDQMPDFVYRLNLSMRSDDGKKWSKNAFMDITGQSVESLWQRYRGSLLVQGP